MRGLPLAAWAYVCGVAALAAGLVGTSSFEGQWPTLAVLAVLHIICDSVPAVLNIERARVSLGFTVGLASVVLLGPAGAALVGFSVIATGQLRFAPVKRLFNSAQFALCGYAAGQVYLAFGGRTGQPTAGYFPRIIWPFGAAVVVYVAVNLVLIGGILVLSRQVALRDFRWEPIAQLAVSYLGYGTLGLLVAGLWRVPYLVLLALIPLFIARWAFAQTRAQQQAHEATLAALCQAVETKDYYTRGHSERVSRGSVMIAQEIGMRPER
ncbi:MAG: metal dependent phosphohydrolase, partial [Streptosporangiaceae bacterium]|nr:metal dependent phosphohydrolase [Streptosporangiaceae bacterium]